MEDDWDLQAVVRGCTTAGAGAGNSNNNGHGFFGGDEVVSTGYYSCFSSLGSEKVGNFSSLPDAFEARNSINGDLHELYKPFFPKSHLCSPQGGAPMSSLSSVSIYKDQSQLKQQQQHQQLQQQKPKLSATSSANSHTPRSKRRKNQLKKICQVPAEALSSDIWAWRKYGQKPIKGSPYPRGYYKCSSLKGCLARKQVERDRSDPGMFIVTYTAEHNHPAPTHRNSLAGITRQKTTTTPPPPTVSASSDRDKSSETRPTCSSPAASMEDEFLALSTNTESKDKDLMEDDDEGEFGSFSEAVSDDLFVGLEELAAPATRDCLYDQFPANFGLPWVANNAATAAGGI